MFPIWPNRLPEMGGLVGREKNIKSSQHLGCSPQRLDAAAVMRAPGRWSEPWPRWAPWPPQRTEVVPEGTGWPMGFPTIGLAAISVELVVFRLAGWITHWFSQYVIITPNKPGIKTLEALIVLQSLSNRVFGHRSPGCSWTGKRWPEQKPHVPSPGQGGTSWCPGLGLPEGRAGLEPAMDHPSGPRSEAASIHHRQTPKFCWNHSDGGILLHAMGSDQSGLVHLGLSLLELLARRNRNPCLGAS